MKKELKFLFAFLATSSVLYILISMFYSRYLPIIGTLNIASTSNNILNTIGIKTLIVDDAIHLPGNVVLKIILECTGIYEMLILSSIMISYPTTIKNKLYGIVSGMTTIYILNMLRLVSISWVLVYHIDKFDFVDRYLWQISLVIFISATYTVWLKLIEQSGSSSQ
jgi:archaeosortase B (VPXXXP-CTERM-specific)